jgi:hypothetical protein
MNLLLKSSLSGSQLDEVIRAGIEASGHRITGPLKWSVVAAEDNGPDFPCVEFTVESVPQPPKFQVGGTRVDRCGDCGGTGRKSSHNSIHHEDEERPCHRRNGTGKITVTLR